MSEADCFTCCINCTFVRQSLQMFWNPQSSQNPSNSLPSFVFWVESHLILWFLFWRSPQRVLVWTQMPRCGRRSPWPPARLSPVLTGLPQTSVSAQHGNRICMKYSQTSDSWIKCVLLMWPGYSEPSSAGCKQYSVGFTALGDSSSTATAEIAVNGMDLQELGFSPAESTTGSSGQSSHLQPPPLS